MENLFNPIYFHDSIISTNLLYDLINEILVVLKSKIMDFNLFNLVFMESDDPEYIRSRLQFLTSNYIKES